MQPLPRLAPDRSRGYLSQDTIAALASATGGAISVVRVSGPAVRDLIQKVSGKSAETFELRRLTRVSLRDSAGMVFDDALAALFKAPDSFTGEDVIELHIHGGHYNATRCLEALRNLGARQALPGEFSFRAVRNGKMSVSQAQAVADLIASSNEGAATLALEKMSGTQNRLLLEIASGLRNLAVLSEAGIDFADQDIDEVSLKRLKSRLDPLVESLKRLHSSYDRGMKLQNGISVAFVGLPNAGKSSFFNALLGEERSIVSEIAGTTRDVVREQLTLRGKTGSVTLVLEDTAGLRRSSDHVEKIGIERTLQTARKADLILFLVDPNTSIDALQEQWSQLGFPSQKTLGLITKSDTVDDLILQKLIASLSGWKIEPWVKTSSFTGEGIETAIEQIISFCERWVFRNPGEVLLTRLDQAQAVEKAIAHLERSRTAPEEDLFASDIRQALFAIGPLIGDTLPDDILGQIFSDFCIGK